MITRKRKYRKKSSTGYIKKEIYYPPEFSVEFKQYIRKRDGYLCSNPECGKKLRLDVHHIDYNRFNTVNNNCISLCRDCHRMIHQSSWEMKHIWAIRLSKIASERESQDGKKR